MSVCRAVDYAHARGIVHRDVSPQNVIVGTEGIARVIDFGIAKARTSAESTQEGQVKGKVPYLAPEQTGRMNRATDYRADFYALGLLFYEMLAGRLPFFSLDPLELIHWHIAKTPPSLTSLNAALPEPLAHIVARLLAKTPEERYQSALGLRADLEHCAREWMTHGRIAPFALGEHDVSDRFLIPQKLYGRAREAESLLAAFARVCEGQSALLTVSGYSGIGKTSLIRELDKPIVRQRGYFCAGKFDQVMRGKPLAALIQALRALARQWLGESETQLAEWRARLSTALGANGGVLAEVIPEIELIIGAQPAPAAPAATGACGLLRNNAMDTCMMS